MKDKNYWSKWAKAAGRRALKTAAQTFVATIGTTATIGAVGLETCMFNIIIGGYFICRNISCRSTRSRA